MPTDLLLRAAAWVLARAHDRLAARNAANRAAQAAAELETTVRAVGKEDVQ